MFRHMPRFNPMGFGGSLRGSSPQPSPGYIPNQIPLSGLLGGMQRPSMLGGSAGFYQNPFQQFQQGLLPGTGMPWAPPQAPMPRPTPTKTTPLPKSERPLGYNPDGPQGKKFWDGRYWKTADAFNRRGGGRWSPK